MTKTWTCTECGRLNGTSSCIECGKKAPLGWKKQRKPTTIKTLDGAVKEISQSAARIRATGRTDTGWIRKKRELQGAVREIKVRAHNQAAEAEAKAEAMA